MKNVRRILSGQDAEKYKGKIVALISFSKRKVIASGETLEGLIEDLERKALKLDGLFLFDNRNNYPLLTLEDSEEGA